MKIRHRLVSHRHNIASLNFSGDSTRIATGSIDKTIKLWCVETGLLLYTLTGHTDGVSSVKFSGDYLLSASYDQTIKVWPFNEQRFIHELKGHTDKINCMCLTSKYLFSASDDCTIHIWEQFKKKSVLRGHKQRVICLAYSHWKQLLCSGGDDNTIRCWNIEKNMCTAIVFDVETPVLSLDFDERGQYMLSGDE